MKDSKKSIWREILRWLPGLLVSVIAIFLIVKFANIKDLRSALGSVNISYLGLGILLTLIWLLVRSFALRVLLDHQPTVWQAFRAINAGYLLNNLFPLRAGEFGKAFVLGRSSKLGMAHVFSTIVIERALDLVCAAVCLLATLPMVFNQMSWAEPLARITLLTVIAGLVFLFFAARYREIINSWCEKISSRWGFIRKYVLPQIKSLLEGLRVLTQPGKIAVCFLWIGISWGIGMALYFLILKSFVPLAPFWWGIFINAVLAMGIAIPSAPSALGVFEAAIVGGLSLVQVDPSKALAFAIIMHFLQFSITGVLGVISLTVEGLSMKSLFLEFRKERL